MDRIDMLNSHTQDYRNNMTIDPMKYNNHPSFDKLNRDTYKTNNGRYWWER